MRAIALFTFAGPKRRSCTSAAMVKWSFQIVKEPTNERTRGVHTHCHPIRYTHIQLRLHTLQLSSYRHMLTGRYAVVFSVAVRASTVTLQPPPVQRLPFANHNTAAADCTSGLSRPHNRSSLSPHFGGAVVAFLRYTEPLPRCVDFCRPLSTRVRAVSIARDNQASVRSG